MKSKKIKEYSFIHILAQSDSAENAKIVQNIKKSIFFMINQFIEQKKYGKENPHTYIVIGFKKTIIKIEKSNFSKLQPLLSFNPNINIYFLSKIDDININNNLHIIDLDNDFKTEIDNFNNELLLIKPSEKEMGEICKPIKQCISGYLIKKGYEKTKINRLNNFINFEQQKEQLEIKTAKLSEPLETSSENFSFKEIPIIKEDEFIEIRDIYSESSLKIALIYHIERGELYVQKMQQTLNNENEKLIKREIENYSKIQHPLMPKFIGVGQNNKYIIIEFINGRTLFDIDELQLNFNEKITIFFELMIIIEFLHWKGFIYRDLKPNNIMIDENKTAVLIDFDRMILKEYSFIATTNDFSIYYHAPEFNTNNFSYESDIYSLGCVFLYMMNPNIPFEQSLNEISKLDEFQNIKEIIRKSINEKASERPLILEMIFKIYISYSKNIQISNLFEIYIKNITEYYKSDKTSENKINQNLLIAQFYLGVIYEEGELVPRNIEKCIHYYTLAANQKHTKAQFRLGFFYFEGVLIKRDMNKSIHYLSLAADNNDVGAQCILGILYKEDELIPRDIKKSIHYFTLAANQNDAVAQFNLGLIYSSGELVTCDINKSIHFYSLAANQNYASAQCNLGLLYSKGELIPRNMNKSIHFYSLAANQNDAVAQFNLGLLYLKGELITRDMNKSIHYYSLAANQNHADAQYNLGVLYEENKLIPRDMNKSINFYSLAANQNHADAQFNLGLLYSKGELIPRDMNKSIHYFSLAANQNHADAQFYLGLLYSKGESIPRDIDKSIHYFSLAANQNHADAQLNLGYLYFADKLIPRDIDKSIHYYTLAANQNNAGAQFTLALIYMSFNKITKAIDYFTSAAYQNDKESLFFLALFNLKGLCVKKNPYNGIEYLNQCLNINSKFFIYSNFIIGYFHHVGLHVKQDIKKAIKCYKESSSFNYSLAKNNLGIIYKHGIDHEVKKELGWAIEYFNEAIKYGNHYISMYNLAHLYFYEKPIEKSNEESIKLLIKSSNEDHYPSQFLLCIVSIYEYGNNTNNIIQELNKIESIPNKLTNSIRDIIKQNQLDKASILKEKYDQYRNVVFIFDFDFFFSEFSKGIPFLENGIQIKDENPKENHSQKIDSDFYEGFGI